MKFKIIAVSGVVTQYRKTKYQKNEENVDGKENSPFWTFSNEMKQEMKDYITRN